MLGLNKLFHGAPVDVCGQAQKSKLSDSCGKLTEVQQLRSGIFQPGPVTSEISLVVVSQDYAGSSSGASPREGGEQCSFHPDRGTLDKLYTFHRVLDGLWGVFLTSTHVFCTLRESIQPCPSWHPLEHACGVWGQWPSADDCTVPVRVEQEHGLHCWP